MEQLPAAEESSGVRTDFDAAKQELKRTIMERLKDYDWLDQVNLKCEKYIENNGTKSTSVEEVTDFLLNDAVKSFPKLLKDEMSDQILNYLEELELVSSFKSAAVEPLD